MGKYFGTDGVRGVANDNLNVHIAYRIGRFLGQYPKSNQSILIASDTRLSKDLFISSIAAGVLASGSKLVSIGVSSTPSISYLVLRKHFNYGIMISASHNPYYDNGIKVFNNRGKKISEKLEKLIEDYIDSPEDYLPFAKSDSLGTMPYILRYKNEYLNFLVKAALPTVSKLKILVDCANGSASFFINDLIKTLSIDATIINAQPNGKNINDNCGSTHLENLIEKMKEDNYDVGFAFDGDADRCLMVAGDGTIIDGDAILYLSALYMKENNELRGNKIVLTIMSNLALKNALDQAGIGYIETQVGDKYVQAELEKNHLALGGEQSGHIIYYNDLNTGDGLLTMIKMLNVISVANVPLTNMLEAIKPYPQKLVNIQAENKEQLMQNSIILNEISKIDEELNGEGRILVRPSGTEPLIRVMIEAKNSDSLEIYLKRMVDLINEEINK